MKPRIKICCIASIHEAKTAISFGASAIGLVGRMPSGPGPLPDELIREIARSVPPPVGTFLLTRETSVDAIVEHHARTLTNTIQAIHVLGKQSIEEAVEISGQVDALLLDSGNPNLTIKELGGTGRVHDWTISRAIRDLARCPVFLAGGLRADNVREATGQVQPFGIDVCSGVRTNGRLDEEKLLHFFRNVPETRDHRKSQGN